MVKRKKKKSTVSPFKRHKLLTASLIIATSVIILYITTLPGAFSFKDISDVDITSATTASDILNGMKFPTRIVTNLSYLAGHYLFGDIGSAYYINMLLHAINSCLVLLLVFKTLTLKIFQESDFEIELDMEGEFYDISISDKSVGKAKKRFEATALRTAFVTAMIFAVHPVMLYSVTNIPERGALLGTFFSISAIIAYLSYRSAESAEGERNLYYCICFSLLAILSSETSIALLPLLFMIDALLFENKRGVLIKRAALYLGILLLFEIIIIFLPADLVKPLYSVGAHPLGARLMTQSRIVFHYASVALFPAPERLSMAFGMPVSTSIFAPVTTLISMLTIAALLVAAYLVRKKGRVLSFIIFWYIAALTAEFIFPTEGARLGRSYMAYPAIFMGLSHFTTILYEKADKSKSLNNLLNILISITILFLSYVTVKESRAFGSRASLWRDTLITAPESENALYNYGLACFDEKNYNEAGDYFSKVVSLNEENAPAHYHLANAYFNLSSFSFAEAHYMKAIELDGTFLEPYIGLGELYLKVNRKNLAQPVFKKALKFDEDYQPAIKALAKMHSNAGEYMQALKLYLRLIELEPDDPYLHYRTAQLYEIVGDKKNALTLYEAIFYINIDFEYKDEVSARIKELIRTY